MGMEWESLEVELPPTSQQIPAEPSSSPLKQQCLWPPPHPRHPGTTGVPVPPSPDTQAPACSLQVFQTLHSTGQSSMVRDWVMLSLSNFTQRAPVAMATWSLSCFFVSASTSPWVAAMYPLWVPGAGPVSLVNTEAHVS